MKAKAAEGNVVKQTVMKCNERADERGCNDIGYKKIFFLATLTFTSFKEKLNLIIKFNIFLCKPFATCFYFNPGILDKINLRFMGLQRPSSTLYKLFYILD